MCVAVSFIRWVSPVEHRQHCLSVASTLSSPMCLKPTFIFPSNQLARRRCNRSVQRHTEKAISVHIFPFSTAYLVFNSMPCSHTLSQSMSAARLVLPSKHATI